MSTPAAAAAGILADGDLPGLVVADEASGLLPGTQVLRMAMPHCWQNDPPLAHVVDEAAADAFVRELDGHTGARCLSEKPIESPVADGCASALKLAGLRAVTHRRLAAVFDLDGNLASGVTIHGLLGRIPGESA
jgi:hypothetical protein